MRRLRLTNVGPLRHADITFGRITFLMGPSDSGKTVAMTAAAFLERLENDIVRHGTDAGLSPEDFRERFEAFCRKDLLGPGARMRFETDRADIEYAEEPDPAVTIRLKRSDLEKPDNVRVLMIPAERSSVSVLNGDGAYPPGFMFADFEKAWEDVREASAKPVLIPGTGCLYRYDAARFDDFIVLPDGREIRLEHASQGMRSRVPLALLLEDAAKGGEDAGGSRLAGTAYYVENPEAFLHPADQRSFTAQLARAADRGDTVVVETQSRHIVYAWNSLLFAKTRLSESAVIGSRLEEILPAVRLGGFEDAAAWELGGGTARSVMDAEQNIILAESLDRAADALSLEFEALLAL